MWLVIRPTKSTSFITALIKERSSIRRFDLGESPTEVM